LGVRHILLDLDNTVYPASSRLQEEIGRRMTAYVSRLMGIAAEEAQEIRRSFLHRYGTTLAGLLAEGKIEDPDPYLEACHPKGVQDYLKKDPALRESLLNVRVPMAILTNSPIEHARRVLGHLEIADLFVEVFDIRFNRFQGKPAPEAYRRVLRHLDLEPPEVLFVDDLPKHLLAFREMGGSVLLVDESGKHTDGELPTIRSLQELPGELSLRRARRGSEAPRGRGFP